MHQFYANRKEGSMAHCDLIVCCVGAIAPNWFGLCSETKHDFYVKLYVQDIEININCILKYKILPDYCQVLIATEDEENGSSPLPPCSNRNIHPNWLSFCHCIDAISIDKRTTQLRETG